MENCNRFLNYDIPTEEVQAAIQQLKCKQSPGTDNVFTELLRHAGEEFMKVIHKLFQVSWKKATVPLQWKLAEVKFLRKKGKKSY